MKFTAALVMGMLLSVAVRGADSAELPDGYWPESKVAEILKKTQTIRLSPDLTGLDANERSALDALRRAGTVMQRIYEDARHHQALRSHEDLKELDRKLGSPRRTKDLLDLYRLYQGPIATTLENAREPFLPVAPQVPGKNVYPPDVTKEQLNRFLEDNPGQRDRLLAERSIVRRVTPENLQRDLAALADGALGTLHGSLKKELEALSRSPNPKAFYAAPYAVAYATELRQVFELMLEAAGKIEPTDQEFAGYLRNRARDFLSNDYESGDASWVTGRFGKLNAQVGAYETYDDALFGVKAFSSFSLLLNDRKATEELRKKLGGLQQVEDALPYEHHKRVREDISVGIYDVIADFGQARGTNTASILPNDPLLSRKYGRTILLRRNVMEHPDLFAGDLKIWKAATEDAFAGDLAPAGNFQRTLWHEVGHYMGVDHDKSGRPLDVALEDQADALEEMKADLVSLFTLHRMARDGTIDATLLRAVQAGGIRRTLQNVKPRKDQPYQTMQLAQFNYFLDRGLIAANKGTARLSIDYSKYPEVITDLLREVLALQYQGDKAAAEAFFTKWGSWTPEIQEKLAARIRNVQDVRFRIVRYGALGE